MHAMIIRKSGQASAVAIGRAVWCFVLIWSLSATVAPAQQGERWGPPQADRYGQTEHPRDRLAHWYASESMRQNEEARSMMCGFTGERWALDYDLHYRWALRANERRVYRNIEDRNRHLARCRSNKLREGQPPEPPSNQRTPPDGRP